MRIYSTKYLTWQLSKAGIDFSESTTANEEPTRTMSCRKCGHVETGMSRDAVIQRVRKKLRNEGVIQDGVHLCKGCTKNNWCDRSRYGQLAGMSIDQLKEMFIDQVTRLGVSNSQELARSDAILYAALLGRCRGAIPEWFEELGISVRKTAAFYEERPLEWHIDRAAQYPSLSAWKTAEQKGVKVAEKLGFYDKILKANECQWRLKLGLDGRVYQSVTERLLANILYSLGVSYEAHPHYPTGENRPPVADFFISSTGEYVEVWMHSHERRGDEGKQQYDEYMKKRARKEALARELGISLIGVESVLYRGGTSSAYRTFVDHVFLVLGHVLPSSKHCWVCENQPALSQANQALAYDTMSAADLARCLFHDYEVSEVSKIGSISQPMAAYLRERDGGEYWKRLDRELAVLANRKPKTRIQGIASREEVERLVLDQRLTKNAYMNYYRNGSLPDDFPSDPRQHWPDWSWVTVRGEVIRKRPQGLTDAQRIVWNFRREHPDVPLDNERDFLAAREAYPDELGMIPKQPDNPTAYRRRGWISWEHFLFAKSKNGAVSL